MTPLNRILRLFRRPMHIRIVGPPDQVAAALLGLGHFVSRRRVDLHGRRIRIDLTIRAQQNGEGR